MSAASKRSLAICILMSVAFAGVAGSFLPQTRADGIDSTYPGPKYVMGNGHVLSFLFDSAVSAGDAQNATAMLNYVAPKVTSIFWTPPTDYTITISYSSSATTSYGDDGDGFGNVWITAGAWNDSEVWSHELTHALQLWGFPQGSDVELFYVEPTAIAMQNIVPYGGATRAIDDTSFMSSTSGVAAAAFGYYENSVGETHLATSIWLQLYAVDPSIFLKLNAVLYGYEQRGVGLQDVASLRELIYEVCAVKTIDGYPLRQWLALEGMIGQNELGDTPYIDMPTTPGYWGGTIMLNFFVVSGNSVYNVTQSQVSVSAYDGVSRDFMVAADIQVGPNGEVFANFSLPTTPPAVRVEIQTSSPQLSLDFLLPQYCTLTSSCAANYNSLIYATPDGWIENMSGQVSFSTGESAEMTGGVALTAIGAIDSSYMYPLEVANVTYPNGGNITNLVTDQHIMPVGNQPDYEALHVTYDVSTLNIVPVTAPFAITTTQTTTATSSQTTAVAEFGGVNSNGTVLAACLAIAMLLNRPNVRRHRP